jgi:hypothetical protein
MKVKDKERLKSIEYNYTVYGYIPLKEWREYYYLKSLRKIIKLKRANRILADKRRNLSNTHKHKTLNVGWSVTTYLLAIEIANLSEQIGRNSNKIQRLRNSYTKFSDKWVESQITRK